MQNANAPAWTKEIIEELTTKGLELNTATLRGCKLVEEMKLLLPQVHRRIIAELILATLPENLRAEVHQRGKILPSDLKLIRKKDAQYHMYDIAAALGVSHNIIQVGVNAVNAKFNIRTKRIGKQAGGHEHHHWWGRSAAAKKQLSRFRRRK